jgi:hypothetical protein
MRDLAVLFFCTGGDGSPDLSPGGLQLSWAPAGLRPLFSHLIAQP